MITPQDFLKIEIENGIGFHNQEFINLCNSTASQLKAIEELNDVKTILDYGGGTGVYAQSYHNAGYDCAYFDIYAPHNEYVKEHAPQLKIVKKAITTDLMSFIEVAEHMTDAELEKLFKQIKPKFILFSSTSEKTDNDDNWGHINVKSQSEWIEFWNNKGYSIIRELQQPTIWTKLLVKL